MAYTEDGDNFDFGDPDGGIVMQWGTDEDLEVYGQFLYEYPVDPNLIGKTINMLAFPPAGITSVSLSIIDGLGASRAWFWNVTPAAGPGPLFNGVSNPISLFVAPFMAGGPGDATPVANGYVDNGVNPANITTLGFDENGNWVTFTGVGPTGVPGPWNYFGRIQTVPEPSTLALLSMGAVAMFAYAWRKRRRR